MNHSKTVRPIASRLGLAVAVALLAACAGSPDGPPPELVRLQNEVERLRGDTRIAPYADDELQRADAAVDYLVRAENDMKREEYDHRLYLADRLVQVAEAEGLGRYAEARGLELGRERDRLTAEARRLQLDRARLAASTAQRNAEYAMTQAERERLAAAAARDQTRMALTEAERARLDAADAAARAEQARLAADTARYGEAQALTQAERDRQAAEQARLAADAARHGEAQALTQAERERAAAAEAQARAELAQREGQQARAELEALRIELADLQTQTTDRGLVVTLGDVLFELDRAELKAGGKRTLDQLARAIQADATVELAVEGHTDSTGSRQYNMDLSRRRAAAVRDYLSAQGVSDERIQSAGLGPDFPVASNGTEAGRQQNRRVEVIVKSPVAIAAQGEED